MLLKQDLMTWLTSKIVHSVTVTLYNTDKMTLPGEVKKCE